MSAPTPFNLAVRFFLVALLVFPGPGARAEEVTTLTAVADATIKQGSPTSNDGSSAEVESRSESSNNFRGLVRFDLTSIAATSAIKTSFLNMRLTTPPPASRSQAVHRLTTGWTEGTVTWNSPWGTAGGDFGAALDTRASGTTQGATVQWTVANPTQGWVDGSLANNGVLVKDTSEDSTAVHAVLKAVQSGSLASSAAGTVTAGLTPAVDPAKSFLIFGTRHNGNRPPGSMLRGRIDATGTQVEFERVTTVVAPALGTIASASAGGGNSTLDLPGVDLSGQNALVVFVGYNNDTFETVTSVVIDPGGASQTDMGAELATIANDDDARIYIFGLVNPPQGTFTIKATFSGPLATSRGSNIVAYPLSGVDTAAAFGTPGTNQAAAGNGNVSVSSAAGELVLGGVAGETIGTSTVAAPAVEDEDIQGGSGSTTHHLATAHQDGASPTVSFSWTHASDHWAAAGVGVRGGAETVDIQWYVAEFLSGVNVQRGEVTQSATTVNVPITPVAAVNQAFVTWSKTPDAADNTYGDDDAVVGELTSTSNLQFRADSANASHIISWQVIEFTNAADINVQKGSSSLLGTALSTTITLGTPVNVNQTFVLCGYRTAGSGADIGARMMRAQLTNSTTITIDRDISGTPDDSTEILCQAVELTNGSTVQRGSENFLSGDQQKLVAITSVDTSRAIAFASVQPVGGQNMGRSPYAADDIIGVGSVTMALSSTQITMERARPSDNLVNAGLVVRYFMDEAASGQGPTQLLDAAAAPLNLPISYDASNYFYTEIETGRGWESTTVNNTGRASILADGTKVQTLLNGSTTGTIELVLRADAVNSSCTRLIHIGAGSESGYFTLQSCNLNNLNFYMLGGTLRGQWNPSFGTAGRTVLHLVYDSTQALAADRVRLYQDGTLLAKTGGSDPPLNETISIPIGKNFVVSNRELCCRSIDGALYYAAYYNSGFSASQVSGNVNVLQANDDANHAVTADIGWFVVEFADIPPEGVRYGARENAGNEPQLEVHHLRNVSLGAASPGISEITVNWTFPGGSTSANYDGVLFAKTLGGTPPTFVPADNTSYLVGDEPVPGETIVANTTSFATLTIVEENGADAVVLPGTQYTYNAHTHDATTITSAAQPSPPHYALGVSQSVTTLTGGGLNKNWSYRTGAAALAPPGLLPGNTVVAGSNDNKVHSMSAATGERRYRPVVPLGTTAAAIQSRPPVILAASSLTGVDVTYVGADGGDGTVYAFNVLTGAVLWQSVVLTLGGAGGIQGGAGVQLDAFSNASFTPTCAPCDLVIVGTRNTGGGSSSNNSVVALNGATGAVVWTFAPGNMDIINSTPLVDLTNNVVWVTSQTKFGQPNLWKLDSITGSLLESFVLVGDIDIDGSPTLNADGKQIYVVMNAGDLVAVRTDIPSCTFTSSPGTGAGVGFPIPIAAGANADDIFFSTATTVNKVNFTYGAATCTGAFTTPATGWTNPTLSAPSAPIFTPPPLTLFFYVGDSNGRLNKIDPSSGAILVTRDVNLSATVGDPSLDLVLNKLYVGDTSGRIYSFDLF